MNSTIRLVETFQGARLFIVMLKVKETQASFGVLPQLVIYLILFSFRVFELIKSKCWRCGEERKKCQKISKCEVNANEQVVEGLKNHRQSRHSGKERGEKLK